MQTQRKAILDSQAELDADSGPAKRRQSGIGARGQGIRVEGDEPFDPYRFQTFEVTPAFRQSILEAPLPLPDRFLEEVPQSQSGHRAGPDDVTLPQNRDVEFVAAAHVAAQAGVADTAGSAGSALDRQRKVHASKVGGVGRCRVGLVGVGFCPLVHKSCQTGEAGTTACRGRCSAAASRRSESQSTKAGPRPTGRSRCKPSGKCQCATGLERSLPQEAACRQEALVAGRIIRCAVQSLR